ncbi:MAG: alanine--glyoxylate aminotransferase family protein [Treponema sp.]|nr:alanine--glyoxylate aminotransferase family protein [Treponema sp.]
MNRNQLNFTVGPVMMDDRLRLENSEQVPYFRTQEFSAITKESEAMLTALLNAQEGSRAVFMTGSGTASMEAAVLNLFTKNDKVLVVNGGSFGERFLKLCTVLGIPCTEVHLPYGRPLTRTDLEPFANKGYTALIMQHNETSTGVLYDLAMAGTFCKEQKLFFLVDAISSFLADPLDITAFNIQAVITGSQKALALPPGMSFLVLTPSAQERVLGHTVPSLYFNLADYLSDGERGQTPFTPAVGIMLLLHTRLSSIMEQGGATALISQTAELAQYFRNGISKLPFAQFSPAPSNALTALSSTTGKSAYEIFTLMKDRYQIFICPNGGDLKDKIFRVGHIGHITKKNMDTLLDAFHDLHMTGEL